MIVQSLHHIIFGLLMISAGSGLQNVLLGCARLKLALVILPPVCDVWLFCWHFFRFDHCTKHFGRCWPCPCFWCHVSDRTAAV